MDPRSLYGCGLGGMKRGSYLFRRNAVLLPAWTVEAEG
jgi:hypothetical protein